MTFAARDHKVKKRWQTRVFKLVVSNLQGLDAKPNSPRQSAVEFFLLTSPFIEPSPPRGRGLKFLLAPEQDWQDQAVSW